MERFLKTTSVYIPKNSRNPKTQNVRLTQGMPLIVNKAYKKVRNQIQR